MVAFYRIFHSRSFGVRPNFGRQLLRFNLVFILQRNYFLIILARGACVCKLLEVHPGVRNGTKKCFKFGRKCVLLTLYIAEHTRQKGLKFLKHVVL